MEHQCAKCNIKMTRSRAVGGRGKLSAVREPVKYFTNKESSTLIPFVCSQCGLTEWYVENPENFK